MIETITIKINKDDRVLKEGDEFIIPLEKNSVNFIVGPNGSGKSTILHYIRAKKHTLYQENKNIHEGISNNDDTTYANTDDFTIIGLDQYDKVFVLDAVDDDPTSFINSASAGGFMCGGGFRVLRMSKGQKTVDIINTFVKKIEKHTGVTTEEFITGKCAEAHSLIILDEVDEGMDLTTQLNFSILLKLLCQVFNATVIAVCHNVVSMYDDTCGMNKVVYDISTKTTKTLGEYFKEQTGYSISITKNDTNEK